MLTIYLNTSFEFLIQSGHFCIIKNPVKFKLGIWIHDLLSEDGLRSMVVNPADVQTKHKEKACKADKANCRKLARNLRSGDIKGIYISSRTRVEDRHLIRTRQSMVGEADTVQEPDQRDTLLLRHPDPRGPLVQKLYQPDRGHPHGKSQRISCPQSPP